MRLIPREHRRDVWYALNGRAQIEEKVISVKTKLSPLVQGGLEKPILVSVTRASASTLIPLKIKQYCDETESNEI